MKKTLLFVCLFFHKKKKEGRRRDPPISCLLDSFLYNREQEKKMFSNPPSYFFLPSPSMMHQAGNINFQQGSNNENAFVSGRFPYLGVLTPLSYVQGNNGMSSSLNATSLFPTRFPQHFNQSQSCLQYADLLPESRTKRLKASEDGETTNYEGKSLNSAKGTQNSCGHLLPSDSNLDGEKRLAISFSSLLLNHRPSA